MIGSNRDVICMYTMEWSGHQSQNCIRGSIICGDIRYPKGASPQLEQPSQQSHLVRVLTIYYYTVDCTSDISNMIYLRESGRTYKFWPLRFPRDTSQTTLDSKSHNDQRFRYPWVMQIDRSPDDRWPVFSAQWSQSIIITLPRARTFTTQPLWPVSKP